MTDRRIHRSSSERHDHPLPERRSTVKRTLFIAGLLVAFTAGAQAQATKSPTTKPPAAKPHKYKKVLPKALAKDAKVTETQAADAAMKAVPGATIDRVELEK